MKDTNTYIKQRLISKHEFSEIDFDLQEEFGFKYESDNGNINDFIIDTDYRYDNNYPIKIDRLINYLHDIKVMGITHVTIDYHVDHIGYVINGYEITKMNKEEIEEYNDIDRQVSEIEKLYRLKEIELSEIREQLMKLRK